ncbi:lipopolysaccharide assembly LapA domain-containing protein [Saccharibacillus sp. JS10]|uniref:LapA family protein n=1 Tax=Saccharibacillus sp. JS10 TaxID=2950552 RepID=UPI00210C5B54|nr:lipopolysaccharide assembly protein LapA domain-containing protein [Saccharibacillus sp. JS10]MCQ4087004.1 lipopolysaccharide assembly protein LapA domain-containing protein [Saccharibacillus sp. JS10]
MKAQWSLILMLVFAVIIAIFAVINVNPVEVNFLFGYANVPLVLMILGSALFGGLAVGMFGIYRLFKTQREVKRLRIENEQLRTQSSTPSVAASTPPPAYNEPTVSADPTPLEPISDDLNTDSESRGFRSDKLKKF